MKAYGSQVIDVLIGQDHLLVGPIGLWTYSLVVSTGPKYIIDEVYEAIHIGWNERDYSGSLWNLHPPNKVNNQK